jgi:uncharacterized SAM-binding protein YcdF (DUF218 family)
VNLKFYSEKLSQRRKIALLTLALLFLLALFFYRDLKRIRREEVSSWTIDHTADCAIVLTGSTGRVREGFGLLSTGQIKKLIISGVNPQASLRQIFPEWPFYGKLDEHDVILERRSTTTYGNALQSLPLIEALRCRDLILITSQLHMYRSRRVFQAELPIHFPLYTRAVVSGSLQPSRWEQIVETAKSLFYSLWAY